MACRHANTRNLYQQRPPSEGRKMIPAARLCDDCLKVLPLSVGVDNAHQEGDQ